MRRWAHARKVLGGLDGAAGARVGMVLGELDVCGAHGGEGRVIRGGSTGKDGEETNV